VLLLALFFIAAVGLSAFFLYRRAKRKKLKREIGERIRKLTERESRRPQIDLDLLTRDFDDEN